jgi:hypothetical protein
VEKVHAQTLWVDRRDQNKDLLLSNLCPTCVSKVSQIIRVGLTKVGKQAERLYYCEKSCNLLPIETGYSNVRPSTSIHSWCRCSRDWLVRSKMPGCWPIVSAAFVILFRINWRCVNQVFHICSFLAVLQTSTDLVKCLEWWQPTQLVCMWTVSHNSCGTLGESVVLKDELRPSQVCILYVNWHQHVVLHLGWTCQHSLGVQCSIWQHRGSMVFITSLFKQCVKIIVHLLLSTVAYGKPVHFQWTGPPRCKDNQLAFWAYTPIPAALLSAVYVGWWLYVWTCPLNLYEIRLNFGILKWFCLISNLS